MTDLEVDYLVVGAGASGMAFVDELLTHSDATVALVDRRHAPGGHWIDAYPFVRLHQPSAFYGVTSLPLGSDAVDATGPNQGFYELAGPDEIRAYYERVLHRRFLPSGRVHWFPRSEHAGDGAVRSLLTNTATNVRVRKKLVDARYVEVHVPATTPPPFEVAEGVRCVAVGEIARVVDRPERYVVVGAGKTALDACVWLLGNGVAASAITWIKPREAWFLNRRFQQPLAQVGELYRGFALQLEAMAAAATVDDLFARLEEQQLFLRVDRDVTPTMFRGAIVSEGELARLREIEDVVRMGHVKRIERDHIVLDEGRVATTTSTLHVHCAAAALGRPPLRPIFEEKQITLQPFSWALACYQAAALGVLEATIADDEEKNRLCPPIRYWDQNIDFAADFLATMVGDQMRNAHAAFRAWNKKTRLNPGSGVSAIRDEPSAKETRARIEQSALPAAMNLQRLVGT